MHRLIPMLAVLALAACATTRMSDSERLALYQAHAGEPVKDIRYINPIGWEKIDDDHLLLNMRPTESYLLRVAGPCLEWAGGSPTIIVSNNLNRLSAKFDRISVPGNPASCRIEEIRPVDVAAVRDAREAMAAN